MNLQPNFPNPEKIPSFFSDGDLFTAPVVICITRCRVGGGNFQGSTLCFTPKRFKTWINVNLDIKLFREKLCSGKSQEKNLLSIMQKYAENFSEKSYSEESEESDVLMEAFGITQDLKKENKQYFTESFLRKF